MPNLALDLSGPIQGITAYADDGKDPCARDCTVTLPEVSPLTNDLKAGGTLSVPDMSQIDSMETTVSKMGVDANFGALAAAKSLKSALHSRLCSRTVRRKQWAAKPICG